MEAFWFKIQIQLFLGRIQLNRKINRLRSGPAITFARGDLAVDLVLTAWERKHVQPFWGWTLLWNLRSTWQLNKIFNCAIQYHSHRNKNVENTTLALHASPCGLYLTFLFFRWSSHIKEHHIWSVLTHFFIWLTGFCIAITGVALTKVCRAGLLRTYFTYSSICIFCTSCVGDSRRLKIVVYLQ